MTCSSCNGDVVVTGRVRGDVTSLNGRVTLVSGARVDGDVVSKDPPRIADSARVGGDIDRARDRFALGPPRHDRPGLPVARGHGVDLRARAVLILLVVPRGIGRHRGGRAQPARCRDRARVRAR